MLNSFESYEYFKSEKLRKGLTPERRILLFKSVSLNFVCLGNFLANFATVREIAFVIKNLKLRKYYPKQTKESYDNLINTIMFMCRDATRFPLRNLLLNNGDVILHFLEEFLISDFSVHEIEHVYGSHRDIMLKQSRTTYEKLLSYCHIFHSYITIEKDLLINRIIKENKVNEAKKHLLYNMFNFNKEQLEMLEGFMILSKIIGGD